MNQHLSTDQLVDRIYEIDKDDHLDQCAECRARLNQLLEMRAASAAPVAVPSAFLAAQRRSIYARMGEKPQVRMKWVPALTAAVCLIAAGVFVHRPEQQTAKSEAYDAQLFSDVYSMEQSTEPLAAKPIQAIFDQDQQ
jgi:predicted anti-sigma-YlaC factor YlaD